MLAKLRKRKLPVFFGFLFDRGLLHHNLMGIENVFNEKVGHRIYNSIMSLNRFKFIKGMITFDDFTTSNARWKKDKFLAFRKVFEMYKKQCAGNY